MAAAENIPIPSRSEIGTGAFVKLASEVLGRAFQFTLMYIAQRTLGPAGFGVFAFGQAAGFVVAQATDLGLHMTTTRALAQGRNDADVVGAATRLKLGAIAAGIAVLSVVALAQPRGMRAIMLAVAVAVLFQVFVEYIGYVLRGRMLVTRDAALMLVLRFAMATCGLLALGLGLGLTGLAYAFLVGTLLVAVPAAWLVRPGRAASLAESWQTARPLLVEALPLGIAILLSTVSIRSPVLLLQVLRDSEAAGLFSTAQKLTEPLLFLPATIMAALFPAIARAAVASHQDVAQLRGAVMRLFGGLGVMLAVAGYFFGPALIELLYGARFEGSKQPIQVLSLALAPMFLNALNTQMLVAAEKQRQLLMLFGATLTTCLISAAILIPIYGAVGAALGILTSELCLFISASFVARGYFRPVASVETALGRD